VAHHGVLARVLRVCARTERAAGCTGAWRRRRAALPGAVVAHARSEALRARSHARTHARTQPCARPHPNTHTHTHTHTRIHTRAHAHTRTRAHARTCSTRPSTPADAGCCICPIT
jgi:hypothetical protein